MSRNRELALKIVEHLEAEPRRFDMLDWVSQSPLIPGLPYEREFDPPPFDPPPCGTVMCFAGWACVLSGHKIANETHVHYNDGVTAPISQVAAALLGELGAMIFHLSSWSGPARYAYRTAETPAERVAALRMAVDYFFPEEPEAA